MKLTARIFVALTLVAAVLTLTPSCSSKKNGMKVSSSGKMGR